MQARELLQKKLGREPNVREISEAVGLPQATVTLALEKRRRATRKPARR